MATRGLWVNPVHLGVRAMVGTLREWDQYFADKVQRGEPSRGMPHAPLLPVVPDRMGWDAFLACVRDEWTIWKNQLSAHQACLLMLYCGLAFYEYDENTFWPQFAKIVGSSSLPPNQQTDINEAFGAAAKAFHLDIKRRDKGSDFVGTAVNLIGIPLSLWDGFLEICDWAAWQSGWKSLSDQEWGETIEKRSGSRTRPTSHRDPASSARALESARFDVGRESKTRSASFGTTPLDGDGRNYIVSGLRRQV